MIIYTNVDVDPSAWDPDATQELIPITPAVLAAMDLERNAVDFRLEAPALFDLIAAQVAAYVPGQEDRIALTTRIAAAVGGYLHDLKVELTGAWNTVDELHRQRETLARQVDAFADSAAYVKGGRR